MVSQYGILDQIIKKNSSDQTMVLLAELVILVPLLILMKVVQ